MPEGLEDIRGVGGRIKEILTEYFGSEEDALRSLKEGEYEKLISAGVPFPKASEIARNLESEKRGFRYADIMKTPDARSVYSTLVSLILKYPKTDYGRIGVSLLYPTCDPVELDRRLDFVEECLDLVDNIREKREELQDLLSDVSGLQDAKTRIDGVIATEDHELFEMLSQSMGGKSQIILVESLEDVEYLKDYEFVRYVQRNASFSRHAIELPNVEPIYSEDISIILPELLLNFFGANIKSIRAALNIAKISGSPELSKILKDIEPDIDAIESAERIWNNALGKKPSLVEKSDALEEISHNTLKDVNRSISERLSSMSISGGDILAMLGSSEYSNVLERLPKDFISQITNAARDGERIVAQKLGVNENQIYGIFSTACYPIGLDQERLAEIKDSLVSDETRREFRLKQETAQQLTRHTQTVRELIRRTMELDLRLAVGNFVSDHDLTRPTFEKDTGVGMMRGRNILIGEEVQSIDYVIGATKIHSEHKENAVVLTGANSGGKTTLLELLVQTVLLSHMGLGAPAENAELSVLDEIYYFKKAQGTDAGAFETLLQTFESLGKSGGKRIILADEIEAVTEPGAAAKILAALLDWFKEDENTLLIIVTHLGEDIETHVSSGVRIDGIEANGLDEDLNLIVNRNPILGSLAKSTPELIVERLYRITHKQEFYKRILERFR